MGVRLDSLDLGYFVEWGGRGWERLLRRAIDALQDPGGIEGKSVLEVGPRYGKMAVLFALLGARVTAVDVSEVSLAVAREEARRWNVEDIDFIAYDGNLDIFPDGAFDIVFTKSVLVVVPNLEAFLLSINRKLKPGGRVVFLENGRGGALLHAMRVVSRRHFDYAHYMTNREVELIRSVFDIDFIVRRWLPPLYLFVGRKRATAPRP